MLAFAFSVLKRMSIDLIPINRCFHVGVFRSILEIGRIGWATAECDRMDGHPGQFQRIR